MLHTKSAMSTDDGTSLTTLALTKMTNVNFFRGDVGNLLRFAPKKRVKKISIRLDVKFSFELTPYTHTGSEG